MNTSIKRSIAIIAALALSAAMLCACNNTNNTSEPESSVQQSSEEKSKTEESTSSETNETQYSVDEVSDKSKTESSEESIQTTKTAPELPKKFWQDTWSTAESEKDIIRYCRCTDETNPMYGYLYGVTSAGGLSYSYYTGVDDKAKDTNIISKKDFEKGNFEFMPEGYAPTESDRVYHKEMAKLLSELPVLSSKQKTTAKNDKSHPVKVAFLDSYGGNWGDVIYICGKSKTEPLVYYYDKSDNFASSIVASSIIPVIE